MGSWNIIAILLPLIFCISCSFLVSISSPLKSMEPSSILPGGSGISRIMDRAVTLLPLPDSPTIPRVSPFPIEKLIPSTAGNTPSTV